MLNGLEMLILVLAGVISVIISTRFVFRVTSSGILIKMVLLRSCIKVFVGVSCGIVLGFTFTMIDQQTLSTFTALFALTCLIASLIGLFTYKWLLSKVLGLSFTLKQFVIGYLTEFVFSILVSILIIFFFFLSSIF